MKAAEALAQVVACRPPLATVRPFALLLRAVIEVSVRDLEGAGATPADLAVLGARPECATVRILWGVDGPKIATLAAGFYRSALAVGLLPVVAVVQGQILPDGPGACFAHASLRCANLCGDYRSATFRGADLRGANMQGGSFKGALFVGAALIGADLRGACFEGADLRGADIREVTCGPAEELAEEWHGAKLSGARWSFSRKAPPGWQIWDTEERGGVLMPLGAAPYDASHGAEGGAS